MNLTSKKARRMLADLERQGLIESKSGAPVMKEGTTILGVDTKEIQFTAKAVTAGLATGGVGTAVMFAERYLNDPRVRATTNRTVAVMVNPIQNSSPEEVNAVLRQAGLPETGTLFGIHKYL